MAPPPSRATHMSPIIPLAPVEEKRTPTPAKTPEDQGRDIMIDFLQRVKYGADKGRYLCIYTVV